MTPPPLLAIAEGRRVRPRKAPPVRIAELQLHKQVVALLRQIGAPRWQWWHTPNGERRDAATGAKLKSMGVMPGVPDLVLVSPAGVFHGLELKAKGGTLSDAQARFQIWAAANGVAYSVADDFDQALAVLKAWGAVREVRG